MIRYIIADKGRQFWCNSFKQWCHRKAIRPRFGAVGKRGTKLSLVVGYVEGRRHLPVVELRKAA